MVIVHVHAHVKLEYVEAFKQLILENARESIKEPGVLRFDIVQQESDPTRFVLVEIYRTEEDPARHKATSHYARFKDAAEVMMAEPRQGIRFVGLFPDTPGWETHGYTV